ncbi:hypothetical protein Nepgr_004399 [Nepenthes gracilis]|uniref:Auxin-responsive protein n=1 Tax=Nepenthes gracilis TaxID=150966 RepID=A0AAD3S1A5_NEPGR|nr:hypothetical protein Nepgr_004399 [Nepenthes gracilis]
MVGGGGGGSGGGLTGGGSLLTVSKEEAVVEQDCNMGMPSVEVSSYPDEAELELGLGLSIGGGLKVVNKLVSRILTANDLPSGVSLSSATSSPSSGAAASSSSSSSSFVGGANNNASAGTKRTADSVTSPTGASQVVGWPPIRAYRMNSLANQAKSLATGELDSTIDESKTKAVDYGAGNKADANNMQRGHLKSSMFVKVNMDGIGIGRKVDLNAHSSYESLARTLEEMFTEPARTVDTLKSTGEVSSVVLKATRLSKLMDGSSDYVLTYEDRDGDWMLVGDVPWEMFLGSVKRLKIMKASKANGLAPRFEEWNAKLRNRI